MPETPPNRLRELREAAGLRKEHLAIEYDVSVTTIERWESGEIPGKHLRPLAKQFAVSVSFLLRDDLPVAA